MRIKRSAADVTNAIPIFENIPHQQYRLIKIDFGKATIPRKRRIVQ